jgi:predicted RecA/RadA family phage recombinase
VKNQALTGTPTSRRFALCPTTVKAGDAVLLGGIPAFALDDYQTLTLGTTFLTNGTFSYSVTAKSSLSPSTGKAINPGDPLYYDGGTLDATTNVTTGGTIDANSSATAFGSLDPEQIKILTTVTNAAAWVRI